MSQTVKQNLQEMSLEEIGDQLYEERREMVAFAEEHDQWQLFDDKQSMGSMREAIQQLEESAVKTEIVRRFNRVELIYEAYIGQTTIETIDTL